MHSSDELALEAEPNAVQLRATNNNEESSNSVGEWIGFTVEVASM